ncbi:hypothetical protein BDW72DRAFT_211210 [Aspergillus terricola var. indicus]
MGSITPSLQPSTACQGEEYGDVVSQFPFLNGYTNLLFGFQIAQSTPRPAIVPAIREALTNLTALIPWLGGQVVHVPGQDPGSSGILQVAPWPADEPQEIVRAQECDDQFPPMPQLLRAGVPIHLLDADILTPWPSLPRPHGLSGPVPVVFFQTNFIRGGVIINLSAHHTLIDGTGIVGIARHLAVMLNGGEIPPDELVQANRDDHSHLRRRPGWTPALPATPPVWCYFRLPLSALARLMAAATAGPSAQGLSENDVICALFWQRVTVVRLARGEFTPGTMTRFSRAIDGRNVVGVPFTYMGHLVYYALTRLTMGEAAGQALGRVAQALRRELAVANTAWAVRSYATFLARESDRSALLYGGEHNPNTDLGSTPSIASIADARDGSTVPTSWGKLGSLQFIRRPRTTPLPGSLTIQPAERRAVPLLVCLPQADLEGLKKDVVWKQYTQRIRQPG